MTLNYRKLLADRYRAIDPNMFEKEVLARKGEQKINFIRECAMADPQICLKIAYPEWNWEWFHRQWLDTVVDAARNDEPEVLILAPRDHGKSAYLTTGLSIHGLIQPEADELRASVVSASKEKASDFIADIQAPLEDPRFEKLFGKMKGNKWGAFQFNIKAKKRNIRGNSMLACGRISNQIVSKHFELSIFDDSIDSDIADSNTMRNKFKKWMANSAKPTLLPSGLRIYIGTRYGPNDYYDQLLKNGIRWNGKNTCSFYMNHESKEIMWPWKFKPGFLEDKIKKDGVANVSMQYFNDVTKYSGNVFRREWFRHTTDPFKDGTIVYGIDVAYRYAEMNDYTAICVLRKRPNGDLVVENMIQGKWSQGQIIKKIQDLHKRWPARSIRIEDPRTLSRGKADKTFLYETLRDMNYPAKLVKPEQKDKGLRWVDNLQHLYENGIIVHREGLTVFEDQLLGAGSGDLPHDDMIDALDIAVGHFKKRKRRAYSPGKGLN